MAEIQQLKTKPQYIPIRCPVCNGFGTVNYGQKKCKACLGVGFIKVPPEEDGEKTNEH